MKTNPETNITYVYDSLRLAGPPRSELNQALLDSIIVTWRMKYVCVDIYYLCMYYKTNNSLKTKYMFVCVDAFIEGWIRIPVGTYFSKPISKQTLTAGFNSITNKVFYYQRRAWPTEIVKVDIRWVSVVEFHDPTLGTGNVLAKNQL